MVFFKIRKNALFLVKSPNKFHFYDKINSLFSFFYRLAIWSTKKFNNL